MGLQQITGNEIAAGSIAATDLASASITGDKLGLTAINANNIVNATITTTQIASNTISNTNIQTGAIENYSRATGLLSGMRNRIINGAMVFDQRNAGVSVTPAGGAYQLDRFVYQPTPVSKFSIQRSTTAPAGFNNSMLLTVVSAHTPTTNDSINIGQYIEGFNVADLNWGTANAKTVTLSFFVNCSVTGTYSVQFGGDNGRGYIGTYTVNSANTWEQKSITVPGDTSGTYGTTNGTGITVFFALGAGSGRQNTPNAWIASGYTTTAATGSTNLVETNGATLYLTGVQLEVGSTATSFDYRSIGTELELCLRYFHFIGGDTAYQSVNTVVWYTANDAVGAFRHPVPMRTTPTISKSGDWAVLGGGGTVGQTLSADQNGPKTSQLGFGSGSGGTTGQASVLRVNNDSNFRLTFNAEL